MTDKLPTLTELAAMRERLRVDTAGLAWALVRSGAIQEQAITDPEGYDGGSTMHAVSLVASGINAKLEPIRNALPHLLAIAEAGHWRKLAEDAFANAYPDYEGGHMEDTEFDRLNEAMLKAQAVHDSVIAAARAAGLFGEVGG